MENNIKVDGSTMVGSVLHGGVPKHSAVHSPATPVVRPCRCTIHGTPLLWRKCSRVFTS